MVNYCCVKGCGRNSRTNPHLYYYGFPRDKNRLEEWQKAIGKAGTSKKGSRVCSRHFSPVSIKNRHLNPDAVPCLHLRPDSENEDTDAPQPHHDMVCNNCEASIVGFLYKCVSCDDYDLCQRCEMQQVHTQHYMLRIPKPVKLRIAENLVQKWRKFFRNAHKTPDSLESEVVVSLSDSSDDDQPITKYKTRNYDSGIDLTEDVKDRIRKEIARLGRFKADKAKAKPVKRKALFDSKVVGKRLKEEDQKEKIPDADQSAAPQVVFADVNNILSQDGDVKPEALATQDQEVASVNMSEKPDQQPVMHVKLSDDLSELMIEVTANNQKMVYKYAD